MPVSVTAEAEDGVAGSRREAHPAPGLPSGVQWRIVVALTVLAMLALLDKYALSLLVQPLKTDLHLSDTEIGLAVGAAFAIANIAAGIPAGWAADRFDRRRIVACGVLLWSAMAALCGMAGGFWSFFIARAGVGLGEGLIPPASYSLIRDGVDRGRHGRAFGIFAMSNTLGPGMALVVGGALIGLIATRGWTSLPFIGVVAPWQITLIVLGLCGFPLTLLAYVFPEPAIRARAADIASYADVLRLMGRERRFYGPLLLFSCCSAMVASALGIWFPAFVGRTFGLPPQTIGAILGLLLMVAGPLGLIIAGTAIDQLRAAGRPGVATVVVINAALLLLFGTTVGLSLSLSMLWLLESGVIVSSTCYLAIVSITVSDKAPPSAVGKVMAVMLIAQGIFGSGLAPIIVGALADHVFVGPAALGHALAATAGSLTTIGLFAAFALRRALIEEPSAP